MSLEEYRINTIAEKIQDESSKLKNLIEEFLAEIADTEMAKDEDLLGVLLDLNMLLLKANVYLVRALSSE